MLPGYNCPGGAVADFEIAEWLVDFVGDQPDGSGTSLLAFSIAVGNTAI